MGSPTLELAGQTVRCVEIGRPQDGPSSLITERGMGATMELENFLAGGEIGDVLTFELIEMTGSELRDLPEFEGW